MCIDPSGRVPVPQYATNDSINYASNGQLHTEQTVPPTATNYDPITNFPVLSLLFTVHTRHFFVAYLTSWVNIHLEMDLEKFLQK